MVMEHCVPGSRWWRTTAYREADGGGALCIGKQTEEEHCVVEQCLPRSSWWRITVYWEAGGGGPLHAGKQTVEEHYLLASFPRLVQLAAAAFFYFFSYGACPGTRPVDQAGFKLNRDLPASASRVLG